MRGAISVEIERSFSPAPFISPEDGNPLPGSLSSALSPLAAFYSPAAKSFL